MSKNRRGGRKVKDIKDPLYLLPFDNGEYYIFKIL